MNRDDLPPTVPPEEVPPDAPRGFLARFRNYVLTGLVVAGPIAITFYLTWWFVTWVDGLVRPFVPIAYRPETYLPFGLPGSGLIVAVIALTLLSFRRVGLGEFPSPGMWSIVLISQAPSEDIAESIPGQEEHISVFLPCAPNPTTGFFFYVPKSKVIEVEMSTEDAATLIMSCGVVQPGSGSDPQKKMAALAGMANAARAANSSTLLPEPAKVD